MLMWRSGQRSGTNGVDMILLLFLTLPPLFGMSLFAECGRVEEVDVALDSRNGQSPPIGEQRCGTMMLVAIGAVGNKCWLRRNCSILIDIKSKYCRCLVIDKRYTVELGSQFKKP
jgi:hypothetical protein